MGEMIRMVVVLTVLSVVSGGGLAWIKGFAGPKIENQEMNLVKGPAIREMLKASEKDPVENRFKIQDGDTERTIFVGVFGGKPDTVVLEAAGNGYGGKVGLAVAINTTTDTVYGISVTTHQETPGFGSKAKDDPSFGAQFAGKPVSMDFQVSQDGGSINAIGGATVTSKAVCVGVNSAVSAYRKLKPQLTEQTQSMGN
ncbi:RnfABCDGE type electron transport complex subunit G [Desulfosarcina sp. OttesenSCG-928-G10]|nr:RnfABCDGE type electron transport complex subunit G [Desulfosarcina sp. OttesenSCG-928-G10]MDL2321665.1 RnfABCDGE type electron transport complex subunit G [Desulfosarcina sp. OttesenSCG-928-B08]